MYLACLIRKAHRSKCVGCSLRNPLDVKNRRREKKLVILKKNEGIIEHWSVSNHLKKPESQQGVERKR